MLCCTKNKTVQHRQSTHHKATIAADRGSSIDSLSQDNKIDAVFETWWSIEGTMWRIGQSHLFKTCCMLFSTLETTPPLRTTSSWSSLFCHRQNRQTNQQHVCIKVLELIAGSIAGIRRRRFQAIQDSVVHVQNKFSRNSVFYTMRLTKCNNFSSRKARQIETLFVCRGQGMHYLHRRRTGDYIFVWRKRRRRRRACRGRSDWLRVDIIVLLLLAHFLFRLARRNWPRLLLEELSNKPFN